MRVLVATKSVDPDRTSGGIGVCRLVRALSGAGHEVTCLTDDWSVPFAPGSRECEVDWLPSVRIRNVYDRAGIDGSGVPREDHAGPQRHGPVGRALEQLERRVWHCTTGHDRRFWRIVHRWQLALAEELARLRPEVVLTRGAGLGFEPHLALARHGNGTAWIANYHDPYPLSLYPPPYARRSFPVSQWQQHWHARIVERAPALTFPSARLRRWVLGRRFAHKLPRSFVLPHVTEPVPADGKPGALRLDGRFAIVHTGTLLAQRDPSVFLEAFARFLGDDAARRRDACCVLVGRVDPRHRFVSEATAFDLAAHGNLVLVKERVTHAQALAVARQATALMVLEADAEASPFLPGKIADYLALGKPVLALSPRSSAVIDLLGADWPLQAHPRDGQRILELLNRLWDAWRTGRASRLFGPPRAAAREVSPATAVEAFERAAAAAREAVR